MMKIAGRITGEAILEARDHVKEGVSTYELDTVIRRYIERNHAKPSFLGYGGFPGSACISINSEVIHGIPKKDRILKEGDIVKIDVGACYHGYHGDSANTFGVGKISAEAQRLIDVTRESFFLGVKKAVARNRIGDIGAEICDYATANGYGVVRRYVGHGVGSELHEDPEVPNYGTRGRGERLYSGMTIAVEPMINQGTEDVRELDDDWTVVTADGLLSAHYEHTIAISDGEPLILTKVE